MTDNRILYIQPDGRMISEGGDAYSPPSMGRVEKLIAEATNSEFWRNCCNCGRPHGEYAIIVISCAACSEGCAINIANRGDCATRAIHPWMNVDNPDEWEPDPNEWPKVAEIRARQDAWESANEGNQPA